MNTKQKLVIGGIALVIVGSGAVATARSGGEPATKQDRASIMGVSPSGTVAIGDQDGQVRGVASDRALDRIQDAAGRAMDAAGIASVVERDGKLVANEEAQRLGDAVMAIEAVPVQDVDGKVVGYMGAGFIELGDIEAVKAAAEQTVRELTGKPYAGS